MPIQPSDQHPQELLTNQQRRDRIQRSPHFKNGRFNNPISPENASSPAGFFKMLGKWIKKEGAIRTPTEPIPRVLKKQNDFSISPTTGLRLTWLGHSSVLIELDGYRILTDPVWSSRISPLGLVGVARFFPSPLPLKELPPLDAVLLSHNHYDHLDKTTIRSLSRLSTKFVTPLGVGTPLEAWGVAPENIYELDWWEDLSLNNLRFVCTPARHFSGRTPWDSNQTLWASWAILGPEHRVYFSGDTGMFPGFSEIGEQFGPFDTTLIEIGAYSSLWPNVHLGPEQAVEAHQALKGQRLLPIHWGTFNLAMHSWTEPVERLIVAAQNKEVSIVLPKPGESIEPASAPLIQRWWPTIPWQTAEEAPVVSSL